MGERCRALTFAFVFAFAVGWDVTFADGSVELRIEELHIVNMVWKPGYGQVGSRDFRDLCFAIEEGLVSALASSSQRPYYKRTVCHGNTQGSILSNLTMEFAFGVSLQRVQDDLDALARSPDGTYALGRLRSDTLPSGRKTKVVAEDEDETPYVKTSNSKSLFFYVTIPSAAVIFLCLGLVLSCTRTTSDSCMCGICSG